MQRTWVSLSNRKEVLFLVFYSPGQKNILLQLILSFSISWFCFTTSAQIFPHSAYISLCAGVYHSVNKISCGISGFSSFVFVGCNLAKSLVNLKRKPKVFKLQQCQDLALTPLGLSPFSPALSPAHPHTFHSIPFTPNYSLYISCQPCPNQNVMEQSGLDSFILSIKSKPKDRPPEQQIKKGYLF